MNERIFTVCFAVFIFFSCRTSCGIYNNGSGAFEVRENIGKLGNAQTQSAITSTELKGEIDRSLEQVGELEQSITNGTGDIEEFKTILHRIRKRGRHKNTRIRRLN